MQTCYEALAYRAYIQGQQVRLSEASPNDHFLEDQFKAASAYFKATLEEGITFTNWDVAKRMNSAICITVGTELESDLVDNFRSVLSSYGEVVCCDEKVFEFNSSKSGMLRVIPAKHQKGL